MADTTAVPEKPKHLNNPRRKFVKATGKKFLRWAAGYQSKQSLVPDTPLVPNSHFDFLEKFTDNWEDMQEEAKAVLKFRDAIPGFQDISPDQYRLAKGKSWKTFVLFGFGQKLEKNAEMAPKTTALLEQVPNLQTAWFSILAPGYHIPAHKGVTKGILRSHIGLIIPKEREKCWIRVGDTVTAWKEGEIFVFDDTYEHEVLNETDEERVILLFDFDRPMKWGGRALNAFFLWALKFSAYYKDPKKNLEDAEARMEAAIKNADAALERMAD
jgi:beta-hydroxylase